MVDLPSLIPHPQVSLKLVVEDKSLVTPGNVSYLGLYFCLSSCRDSIVVSGPHSEGDEVGGAVPEEVEDTVRAVDIMGT